MKELLTAKRLLRRIALALIILVLVMLVCSVIGTEKVSLRNVFAGHADGKAANPDYQIFIRVRVPRVILAAIVGAALASAGVVFQALLRNPLAEPYILGISSGAGLGAISAVILGIEWTLLGRSPLAVFAFAGALGTVWLVWFIAKLAKKNKTTTLLLAGVVVNAFFSAVIMLLISVAKSSEFYSTIFWLMGNILEEEFFVLWLAGGFVALAVMALYKISPQLNAMTFGPQDAKNLGINTAAIRTIAFAVASAVTAVAVSLSGLIGFVGLIVPHAVRLLFGADHRQLIPLSAVAGAVFLVAADTIARTIVAPAQMPVGIITAIVGGPFFLVLLIRHTRKSAF